MKLFLCVFCLMYCSISFGQKDNDTTKPRKMSMYDFQLLISDDTGSVVIDLFFKKRDQAVFNNMSLLPISVGLCIAPQTRFFGFGTAIITIPLFLNGTYMLTKYSKKKLYNVLTEYMETGHLPPWLRKKANKTLKKYEELPMLY